MGCQWLTSTSPSNKCPRRVTSRIGGWEVVISLRRNRIYITTGLISRTKTSLTRLRALRLEMR